MTLDELLDDPRPIELKREMKLIATEMGKKISMEVWRQLCDQWQWRAEELVAIIRQKETTTNV